MGEIEKIIRKNKSPLPGLPLPQLPMLPDPNEIKEAAEALVQGVTGLKDVPKTLIDGVVEADQDFRSADRALRSARFGGKKGKG